MDCSTYGEARTRAKELAQSGYTVRPSDDLERCVLGFRATRPGVEGVPEESFLLEYKPYGKALKPEIQVAKDVAGFITLLDALRPKSIYRCCDPNLRHEGFVSYDGEAGISRILRIPLTLIKDGVPASLRAEMELHRILSDLNRHDIL